ncbi:hypothetical protein GA0070619_4125 [Micromonospora zamorensis]|nr:hypothetical protein GA0070619_4125 [Micromonospora zamorensis]
MVPDTDPVISLPHGPSGLSKATWTDADFLSMGWHDCRIHALSIADCVDDTLPPARMLLDLDYIVRWVQPAEEDQRFTFWIAPATLVFDGAWGIDGRLGPLHDVMEIADLHRLESPDNNPEPLWHIEGQNFDLRLRAPGYTQFLRMPPQHVAQQILTPAERAGISFAELSFA